MYHLRIIPILLFLCFGASLAKGEGVSVTMDHTAILPEYLLDNNYREVYLDATQMFVPRGDIDDDIARRSFQLYSTISDEGVGHGWRHPRNIIWVVSPQISGSLITKHSGYGLLTSQIWKASSREQDALLAVGRLKLNNRSLNKIGNLDDLKILDLFCVKAEPIVERIVAASPNIEHLVLPFEGGEFDFSSIPKTLKSLCVYRSSIEKNDMIRIFDLPQLNHLIFIECRFQEDVFKVSQRAPMIIAPDTIKTLRVQNCLFGKMAIRTIDFNNVEDLTCDNDLALSLLNLHATTNSNFKNLRKLIIISDVVKGEWLSFSDYISYVDRLARKANQKDLLMTLK